MKYALYPGCAAQGATPELYLSTRAIIGRLGIEVVELKTAACCGAGVVTEADPDMALAINARTFAQAEALGLDVMTICGTCQGVMSAANRRLKMETETLDRINTLLFCVLNKPACIDDHHLVITCFTFMLNIEFCSLELAH